MLKFFIRFEVSYANIDARMCIELPLLLMTEYDRVFQLTIRKTSDSTTTPNSVI